MVNRKQFPNYRQGTHEECCFNCIYVFTLYADCKARCHNQLNKSKRKVTDYDAICDWFEAKKKRDRKRELEDFLASMTEEQLAEYNKNLHTDYKEKQ